MYLCCGLQTEFRGKTLDELKEFFAPSKVEYLRLTTGYVKDLLPHLSPTEVAVGSIGGMMSIKVT